MEYHEEFEKIHPGKILNSKGLVVPFEDEIVLNPKKIKEMIDKGKIKVYNDDESKNIFGDTNIEIEGELLEIVFKKYLTRGKWCGRIR